MMIKMNDFKIISYNIGQEIDTELLQITKRIHLNAEYIPVRSSNMNIFLQS